MNDGKSKHPINARRVILLEAVAMLLGPGTVRSDIYQWEYVSFNTSQKRESGTLAPDGAGASAVPGANFNNRDLTMAYLIGADLSGAMAISTILRGADLSGANLTGVDFTNANFSSATLIEADLSQANLTDANFRFSFLTDADFTGTDVRGANFGNADIGGFTAAQLYSTASYQAGDMSRIDLAFNNLIGWNFAGQNLANARFFVAALYGADLTGANLTNADFRSASLTDADFMGAEVRGARFGATTGGLSAPAPSCCFTAAQLYSTASYQAGDLSGIDFGSRLGLGDNDLTGWNFAEQNLTNADFFRARLTDADFTGAEVRGADFSESSFDPPQLYSTASYQARDLSGIWLNFKWLKGWNFAGQNLTDASFADAYLADADFTGADLTQADLTNAFFGSATLTGANFTGAEVRRASFENTTSLGFSAAQLYSTASYQARELGGIWLNDNDLAGWNFAGQNLTNADFRDSTLTDANLSGADTRGATFSDLNGTITSNTILPDGSILGLDLAAGQTLVIRDYDGDPIPSIGPLPIVVNQQLTMDPAGTLRLVFDADEWDSTISFASEIAMTLGGTLELTFAPDVNVVAQNGRTIDLFDWTGVTPTGMFTVSSPYIWDLSNLYTTGEVMLTTVVTLPGDYKHDGTVDAADYIVWRKGLGGAYTQDDYHIWKSNFGTMASARAAQAITAVPESSALRLAAMAICAVGVTYARRRSCSAFRIA